jgi:hypothetical protein
MSRARRLNATALVVSGPRKTKFGSWRTKLRPYGKQEVLVTQA